MSEAKSRVPESRWAALCAALVLIAAGRVGEAHHSFAMFDADKNVTLAGTVREFQFTNPHCWIQLMVPKPNNTDSVEWSIEMAAPAHLVRSGWSRNTVKAGDKIIVVIHPLKDGTQGGSFVSATDESGHAL
jgi:hypothetical protein